MGNTLKPIGRRKLDLSIYKDYKFAGDILNWLFGNNIPFPYCIDMSTRLPFMIMCWKYEGWHIVVTIDRTCFINLKAYEDANDDSDDWKGYTLSFHLTDLEWEKK